MMVGDELVGVLNVESDRREAFGERDIRVLSILASQAALALQNANLFSQRDDLYLATLDAMARTIDARDPYTAGHSQRVAQYSAAIGKALGLDQKQLSSLERGGVLHDIGKIGVSDAVLRKPGPLTSEERTEIEQHPVIGYALLRDMSFIADVLDMVRHHHERWDGRGYPDQLKGQEIPLAARIMAVADAFDSMTSNRPYRNSLPLQVARARLLEASGTQFWPPAVNALVEIVDACALPTGQRELLGATA
jgi:putative nucleotidyltransferase with HDIG domain